MAGRLRAVIVSSIDGLPQEVAKRWTPRLAAACELITPDSDEALERALSSANVILGDPALITDSVLHQASALQWCNRCPVKKQQLKTAACE
jgi:hypothetical protein